MFDIIFAPEGKYPPCGMFSATHIITVVILFAAISVALYMSRNISEKKASLITGTAGIVVACLECVKITYCLLNGQTSPNSFVPLHYCSLFIYAAILSEFGSKRMREAGRSFLSGAAIIAGGAFMIFPSTSLTTFPIYHFQSMYSMLFHSLMIYTGGLCLIRNRFDYTSRNYIKYVCFFVPFALMATGLNLILDCNLMFLSEPYKIPIPLLFSIHEFSGAIYTIIMFIVYLIFPYFVPLWAKKIYCHLHKNSENSTVCQQQENEVIITTRDTRKK